MSEQLHLLWFELNSVYASAQINPSDSDHCVNISFARIPRVYINNSINNSLQMHVWEMWWLGLFKKREKFLGEIPRGIQKSVLFLKKMKLNAN